MRALVDGNTECAREGRGCVEVSAASWPREHWVVRVMDSVLDRHHREPSCIMHEA
jgi:hypothetical protein